MSSLMQHHGSTTNKTQRGKVELLFYLVERGPEWEKYNGPGAYKPSPESTTFCNDVEPMELTRPNGSVTTCPKLYRAWRVPVGMWGNWVVFRYNGKEHVPDLSVPIAVFKLPRDAEALTQEEATRYWFS